VSSAHVTRDPSPPRSNAPAPIGPTIPERRPFGPSVDPTDVPRIRLRPAAPALRPANPDAAAPVPDTDPDAAVSR
jgi:hypothetical protein